jgi:tetratricopeptide (TPR) repeat protein
MPTTLRLETKPWLAAALGGENPQAVFRDREFDMPVIAAASLPPAVAATIGQGCGRRVLPYRLQDRYGRERSMREFRAIVLENEQLTATFLPDLGGRLISLVHRPAGRELLYHNPVFQPANLALRDAWFAGGIEWNIAQFGHAYHTCAPVFAAAIPGLDGSPALRLYDFDRCKSLLWQIDFHLPPGAGFLHAVTRVVNPTAAEVAMYWWTNVAIAGGPELRVLAPASRATFVDYAHVETGLAYGECDLPGLPIIAGADGTYPRNLPFINEFFFQCQHADLPWEAALDAHGDGFIEASTHPLNVRKMFCWGMHQGGRHWQEFLATPGQQYIEIQAGLAPTQQHTVPMPAHSEWVWTQAFGPLSADPAAVHGSDWTTAWQAVDHALKQRLTRASLQGLEARCRPLLDSPPTAILHAGTGWGALERHRRARQGEPPLPPAFAFPDETLGAAQQRWLELLETGALPEQDPAAVPGEWLIQPEWLTILEISAATPANRHWEALLHLGVMQIEAGDEAGARMAWEESLQLRPSAWAERNLGALEVRRGAPAAALPHYQRAWALAGAAGTPDVSFALEYLAALHAAAEFDTAWTFYQALPPAMRALGTVQLLAAKVALERGDLAFVEAAFEAEFASIREGATDLTNLWFGFQARRLAARDGLPLPAALAQVRQTCPPPYGIDFRVME